MESKYPKESGIAIETLLDPSNPLVIWVILPAAVLAALGMKRGAIFWIMAFVIWTIGRQLL